MLGSLYLLRLNLVLWLNLVNQLQFNRFERCRAGMQMANMEWPNLGSHLNRFIYGQ